MKRMGYTQAGQSQQHTICLFLFLAGGETDAEEAQKQTNRDETGAITLQIHFIKAFYRVSCLEPHYQPEPNCILSAC